MRRDFGRQKQVIIACLRDGCESFSSSVARADRISGAIPGINDETGFRCTTSGRWCLTPSPQPVPLLCKNHSLPGSEKLSKVDPQAAS